MILSLFIFEHLFMELVCKHFFVTNSFIWSDLVSLWWSLLKDLTLSFCCLFVFWFNIPVDKCSVMDGTRASRVLVSTIGS